MNGCGSRCTLPLETWVGTNEKWVTAIGALDIAIWDLKGKMLETPIHRLLGGYRNEIPAYADGRMAIRTPEQHAEWSAHFIHDMGYRATKIPCDG